MMHLNVWLTLPEGQQIQVGEIGVTDPDARHGGKLNGAFRYSPAYLSHPQAFALDPVHLPLAPREFLAERPEAGVHAVFEDSLPDAWGRRVMLRRYNLARHDQRVPHLLKRIGANALGALSYAEVGTQPRADRSADVSELAVIVEAALRFDAGQVTEDDNLAMLFQACSSPGGARPKALVSDAGRHWIAKFPSLRDTFALVELEAATLHLARAAGITVPETRIEPAGRRRALLVERFDIRTADGRYHMLSLQTLLGAEGYYHAGYGDIADTLRQWSYRPGEDLAMLFRMMVFNIVLGNTDDHLKNFSMLHDERGWRLAPAYDLTPNWTGNTEHQLSFGTGTFPPDRVSILRNVKSFGLSAKRAAALVDEVVTAAGNWKRTFNRFEVPHADVERLEADIRQRQRRMKA